MVAPSISFHFNWIKQRPLEDFKIWMSSFPINSADANFLYFYIPLFSQLLISRGEFWLPALKPSLFSEDPLWNKFWPLAFVDYSGKLLYQKLYCFASLHNIEGLYNRRQDDKSQVFSIFTLNPFFKLTSAIEDGTYW